MKTRPILFTVPMVRALLAGTKTQTRRLIQLPMKRGVLFRDVWRPFEPENPEDHPGMLASACPFGVHGDRLWVRETARAISWRRGRRIVCVRYEADGTDSGWLPYPERLKDPIVGRCIANGVHREGARLMLEVADVRVQCFGDISEKDAKAEGMEPFFHGNYDFEDYSPMPAPVANFRRVIGEIYGREAWNQWCWAVTFRRLP